MDRDTAREQLKENLRDYVESITAKSKGANLYICPLCHSGEGKNGTGAFSLKNETSWKCFSCNKGGDIFDLIGEYEGIADHTAQLKRAGELFGLAIDKTESTAQHTHKNIHTTAYTQPQTPEADYTTFFLEAHSHIAETDYPQRRGLSQETIDRFNLGYVAEWRHPKAQQAPASPRLIIPTAKGSYLARDTREEIPDEQKTYSKSKVGSVQLFNKGSLRTAKKPVFIVEGEIDALSIIEVGGEAVALGSTTKVKALVELLKVNKPSQPLIIALDNDKAGQKASEELIDSLKGLGIPYYRLNPAGEYKDANETLQKNREALAQAVADAEHIQDEAEQAENEKYLSTSTINYLQSFLDGIADSVNTPCISTGFNSLDNSLDGGLYEGLYVIGAISSLGKTTFCLQMADQIARSGKEQDVLIFSLEMARTELIAKSISRHTAEIELAQHNCIRDAKTVRGITVAKFQPYYSETEQELIHNSIEAYKEYADRIYISEGIGNIGTKEVRETVEKHIRFTGRKPVVIIDYLQILAPHNERATDKQNTDKAVMELKRISRDYKLPVIGISSFNRANYKEAVTMEAFKESGAIEYSSDVLIGLQLKRAGEQSFNANEAKQREPREVELVILKNRNGRTGDKLAFNYYPKFNYFFEDED